MCGNLGDAVDYRDLLWSVTIAHGSSWFVAVLDHFTFLLSHLPGQGISAPGSACYWYHQTKWNHYKPQYIQAPTKHAAATNFRTHSWLFFNTFPATSRPQTAWIGRSPSGANICRGRAQNIPSMSLLCASVENKKIFYTVL